METPQEELEEPDVNPEPEEGDFFDDLPVEVHKGEDGNDNNIAEELKGLK